MFSSRTAARQRPAIRASNQNHLPKLASQRSLTEPIHRKRKVSWLLLSSICCITFAPAFLFLFTAMHGHPVHVASNGKDSYLDGKDKREHLTEPADSEYSIHQSRKNKPILTLYLEQPITLDSKTKPLPMRRTKASKLKMVEFPKLTPDCDASVSLHLPIDDFVEDDPFLPWLHDYFTSPDGKHVWFVAQNRRRCETGDGKEIVMKYWEPQIALLQAVPVKEERYSNGTTSYRLASPEDATHRETRFLCHFHFTHIMDDGSTVSTNATSLSEFFFNYEYVLWRKGKLPMFKETGQDVGKFETSQLLFSCPIPPSIRKAISDETGDETKESDMLYLDLVPIRTPARTLPLMTSEHMGEREFSSNAANGALFNTTTEFGRNHYLPTIQDSGRWANLPVCNPKPRPQNKSFYFVGCTWTSASYLRRGDATVINDSAARLVEWILFHKLVGMEQIYLYDNTVVDNSNGTGSPLKEICDRFDGFCVYHSWPATVCSNNRPNFKNPGERSSQYAADAACRTKYGPSTEWMAFIDTDEYLVPMRSKESWGSILADFEKEEVDVLKLRSSRGRPRLNLMEVTRDQDLCVRKSRRKGKFPEEPCVLPRRNETFLRVFNCDYIGHPRPERFSRAMKQIYRPAKILSHFVHYSTVTSDIARYFNNTPSSFKARVSGIDYHDIFLDELTEGLLVHAKSVLPHETMTRSSLCQNASKHSCAIGHACPASMDFDDANHQKNIFHTAAGEYCNCWVDELVESYWVPKLERELTKYALHKID